MCCEFKKWTEKISEIEKSLAVQSKILLRIERLLTPWPATSIEFFINNNTTKVVNMFLKVNQSLPLSIAIKDSFGNPARVDGLPVWALTNEALGSIVVSADGMSATLSPSGVIGMCDVQVRADADLGEGIREILGVLNMEFIAGDAAIVEISAGVAV
jgi:hypothetical protein